MATRRETMLQMMDAAANTGTAAMMSAGDTFEGMLSTRLDEDWIAIELSEGHEYTITVGGDRTAGKLNDSILKLLDGKGGLIDMNDDKDPAMGDLSSELKFKPEAGSGTQTYYISVSAYTVNPAADNKGGYTLSVTAMEVLPAGEGADIMGTDMADKLNGTADGETIEAMGGHDTINAMGGADTVNGGGGNDLITGGPGADKLNGGAGNDTIAYHHSPMGVTINLRSGTAGGGDAEGDTIGDDIENVIGSMYDDELTGNSQANKLWGLDGNDELDGGRRGDMLWGGAGDDELDGGDGDDVLEGGYGADALEGGEGDDTASYSTSMMGVTVRLHSGRAMGGDAKGDTWNLSETVEYTDSDEEDAEATVADIENLTGSAHADILAGDLRDNFILGGGGDDKIYGGPNPADADKEGGSGISNADTLHGDGGNDMIFGGFGNDVIFGGAGDDVLNGGAGNDTYYGGAGSDMIHADSTDTTINGWLIQGLDANEDGIIDNPGPYVGPANVPGGFLGDPVNESLEATNDPMAIDTVSYAKLEEGVTRTLNDPGATTAAGGATITNVENIIGSQGDDTLTGSNQPNVIEGHEGGDTLNGGAGEDTLSYEHSDDWVRVTLNGVVTNGVTDSSPAATTSRGHASGDTATNFENVRGSAFDDDLTGDALANKLWGFAGDDDLDGAGGNDMIEGGAGADELDGGYTDGDAGTDGNQASSEVNTLSYATSNARVTVNLVTASASGGHATGDTIETYEEAAPLPGDAGNEIDVATFANVIGSMYNDRLTGNHHDNHLTGGAGDDTLRGGASSTADDGIEDVVLLRNPNRFQSTDANSGRPTSDEEVNPFGRLNNTGDILNGGPGADYLDGGEDANEKNNMVPGVAGVDDDDDETTDEEGEMAPASVDVASYHGSMAGVTVNLATGRGTAGDADGDTLVNIEQVWGSSHDDTFIAGPGADNVMGHAHVRIDNTPTGDTVSYELSPEGVTVDLRVDVQPAQGDPDSYATGDVLRGIEVVIGSDHADTLTADDNGLGPGHRLEGGGGNDTLTGGSSVDILLGGDGDDTINAGGNQDIIDGGAGDDTINAGGGTTKVTGGPGSDDMDGGGAIGTESGENSKATFIFSPEEDDVNDVDLIQNFNTTPSTHPDAQQRGERLDLRAYGFESDGSDLIPLISLRGEDVIIDLRSKGGGIIILGGVNDLDDLEVGRGSGDNNNNMIDELDIWKDENFADSRLDFTENDGRVDGNEAGIFIL